MFWGPLPPETSTMRSRPYGLFGLRLTILTFLIGIAGGYPANAGHLFDPDSGFEKARSGRVSIRTCDGTGVAGVEDLVSPWNLLAGWELFVITCDSPDVTFREAPATWVEANYLSPFSHCTIHAAEFDTNLLRHELGHCLGFADHVRAEELAPQLINAAICDDPSTPHYLSYRGIMSYCDWDPASRWFGDDDRQMLIVAGYGVTAGLPSSQPSRTEPAARGRVEGATAETWGTGPAGVTPHQNAALGPPSLARERAPGEEQPALGSHESVAAADHPPGSLPAWIALGLLAAAAARALRQRLGSRPHSGPTPGPSERESQERP